MSCPIDNSIFLLKRWRHRFLSALVLTLSGGALAGQSTSIVLSYAAESPHFRIVASPRAANAAEKTLRRLETARAALMELHGRDWVAEGVLHVWLPESSRTFRRIVNMDYERGLFVSGPRLNWIAIDPDAAQPEELIVHEYLHAVLHRRYRDLPRWMEEGVCEYYATLRYITKSGQSMLETGIAPGNRLAVLRRSGGWDEKRLSGKEFPGEAYAWAWAHIHKALQDSELAALLENRSTRKWMQPRSDEEYKATLRPAPQPEQVDLRRLDAVTATELRALAAAAFETAPGEAPGEAKFLEGLRLLDDGQATAARPLLEEALRVSPSQSSWWLTLANAYGELKLIVLQREAARKALNTAVTDTEKKAAEAALTALN
jgi:tetratricopeptide (TPR) repeat protein